MALRGFETDRYVNTSHARMNCEIYRESLGWIP